MKNNYEFQKLKQSNSSIRNLQFLMVLLLGLLMFPAQRLLAQTIEDGTAEHPFLIENANELKAFEQCMKLGNEFYFKDGTYYVNKPSGTYKTIKVGGKGACFKLTDDIVLSEDNIAGCNGTPPTGTYLWTPMSTFYGVFDGDGHTISGLYINHPTSEEVAFISVIADTACVKNLGLSNVYVNGSRYVAGLVGMATAQSRIQNCYVDGFIYGSGNYVGGIVAYNNDQSVVDACYATGKITAPNLFVGGICGQNATLAFVSLALPLHSKPPSPSLDPLQESPVWFPCFHSHPLFRCSQNS